MKGNIAKAIILLVIISILELLVLIIATVLQTASDLKLKMTSDALFNQIIETVLSPISTAMNFIDDKNPIVIILGIAVPIYVLYAFLKPSKKRTHLGKLMKNMDIMGQQDLLSIMKLLKIKTLNYKVRKKY